MSTDHETLPLVEVSEARESKAIPLEPSIVSRAMHSVIQTIWNRGVPCAISSTIMFTASTSCMKHAAKEVSVIEIMFFRSSFSVIAGLGSGYARDLRPLLGSRDTRVLLFFRGAVGSISMLCNYGAVSRLPLGDAVVISYLAPASTAVLACVLLGEWLGWKTIAGATLSLCGVVAVAKPDVIAGLFASAGDATGAVAPGPAGVSGSFAEAAAGVGRRLLRGAAVGVVGLPPVLGGGAAGPVASASSAGPPAYPPASAPLAGPITGTLDASLGSWFANPGPHARAIGFLGGVSSALLASVAYVIIRKIGPRESPLVLANWFYLCSWVISSVSLATGFPSGPTAPSPRCLVDLLVVGVTSFFAQLLLGRSLQLLPASIASSVSFTQVISLMVVGALAFGEPVTLAGLLGSITIGAGVLLVSLDRRPQPLAGAGEPVAALERTRRPAGPRGGPTYSPLARFPGEPALRAPPSSAPELPTGSPSSRGTLELAALRGGALGDPPGDSTLAVFTLGDEDELAAGEASDPATRPRRA